MTKIGHTAFAAQLPAPGSMEDRQWVQLLPLGSAMPRDNRPPWQITDPQAIVAASAEIIATGMPVDFNHAMESDDRTRHAPAAGWIEALQVRDDGIWGEIAWTSEGRDKIAGRVYRYISPVFAYGPDRSVQAILRAGLTNTPALSMTAICNTEEAPDPDWSKIALDDVSEADLRLFMNQVLNALSMPLETRLSDVIDGIRSGVADPAMTPTMPPNAPPPVATAQAGTLEAMADLLLSRTKAESAAEQERLIATATSEGRLPPALRGWATALCSSDPDAFREFLRNSPFLVGRGDLLSGKPPTRDVASQTDTATAICTQLGLKPGSLT